MNVRRKQAEKELHRKRSLEGMQAKNLADPAQYSSDDDYEYYRQEVGAEPSQELMLSKTKRPNYEKPFRQKNDEFKSKFVSGKEKWRKRGFSDDKKRNFTAANKFDDRRKISKFGTDNNRRHKFSKKFGSKAKSIQSRKVSGGKVFRIRKNR